MYKIISVVFVLAMSSLDIASQEDHLQSFVSLRCESQPLRIALDEIRRQTGTHFVFKDSLVDRIKVSCDIDSLPIRTALAVLFADSPLDFSFSTNNLVAVLNRNDKSRITSYESYLGDNKASKLPVLKFRPAIVYPPEARSKRITGTVEVSFLVSREGNVEKAKITKSCGHEILDQAAKEYCRRLKYYPARQSGASVSVWMSWVFKYGSPKNDLQRDG